MMSPFCFVSTWGVVNSSKSSLDAFVGLRYTSISFETLGEMRKVEKARIVCPPSAWK